MGKSSKEIKLGGECYCLYVNLTSTYISFKIEVGKFLGGARDNTPKNYFLVEHQDDEVNYLSREDIFKTEEDAVKGLSKILINKYKKV